MAKMMLVAVSSCEFTACFIRLILAKVKAQLKMNVK